MRRPKKSAGFVVYYLRKKVSANTYHINNKTTARTLCYWMYLFLTENVIA